MCLILIRKMVSIGVTAGLASSGTGTRDQMTHALEIFYGCVHLVRIVQKIFSTSPKFCVCIARNSADMIDA